jgi:hypothetical protein
MIKALSLSLLLGGCTLEASVGTSDERPQVALVPVTVVNDVDILFVIDDSPLGNLELQQSLQQAFPSFVQALGGSAGLLPSVHIGVVTTDLGTKGVDDAEPGPGIGSGPGSCSGSGKSGNLQTNGTTLVTGTFISDIDTGGGVRETNYTGTLTDAFNAISSVGAAGCGFEQPLHAAKRALANNPANVGFLRENARLTVIFVANEDDCSVSHSTLMGADTASLGPLQSFRCTRFGVICDEGGKTPDQMNAVGDKSSCHSSPSTEYLTSVQATADFLKSLKRDPRDITVGAIGGVATSLRVELKTPPGGGTAMPTLDPTCVWSSVDGAEFDPAIRINELAGNFERNRVRAACGTDLTAAARDLGLETRSMLGRDECLTLPIALPPDCEVWDTHIAGFDVQLPACTNMAYNPDCWRIVNDSTCAAQGLKIQVMRTDSSSPDTMVSVRCKQ